MPYARVEHWRSRKAGCLGEAPAGLTYATDVLGMPIQGQGTCQPCNLHSQAISCTHKALTDADSQNKSLCVILRERDKQQANGSCFRRGEQRGENPYFQEGQTANHRPAPLYLPSLRTAAACGLECRLNHGIDRVVGFCLPGVHTPGQHQTAYRCVC